MSFNKTPSMTHVIQGDYAVSNLDGEVLYTILGSCVSTCIHDPKRGVGGMNHFLLPQSQADELGSMKYGSFAMELLINELLKLGASRSNLEAKVFGGAAMSAGLTDIGKTNAFFALTFLQNERIPVTAQSLGGTKARKIRFWPSTGRVQHKLVDGELPEKTRPVAPPPPPKTNDVDFF